METLQCNSQITKNRKSGPHMFDKAACQAHLFNVFENWPLYCLQSNCNSDNTRL